MTPEYFELIKDKDKLYERMYLKKDNYIYFLYSFLENKWRPYVSAVGQDTSQLVEVSKREMDKLINKAVESIENDITMTFELLKDNDRLPSPVSSYKELLESFGLKEKDLTKIEQLGVMLNTCLLMGISLDDFVSLGISQELFVSVLSIDYHSNKSYTDYINNMIYNDLARSVKRLLIEGDMANNKSLYESALAGLRACVFLDDDFYKETRKKHLIANLFTLEVIKEKEPMLLSDIAYNLKLCKPLQKSLQILDAVFTPDITKAILSKDNGLFMDSWSVFFDCISSPHVVLYNVFDEELGLLDMAEKLDNDEFKFKSMKDNLLYAVMFLLTMFNPSFNESYLSNREKDIVRETEKNIGLSLISK